MKINEVTENVVSGNFGSAPKNTSLDIPQGFDSFYAMRLPNSNGGRIIGVRADGSEKTISTTSDFKIADALTKEYNSGGTAGTSIKPLSLTQAFGSDGLNVIKDAGIKILEKPSYFDYVRDNTGVTEIDLKRIEKGLGEHLEEYWADEIFTSYVDDIKDIHGPLADVKLHPEQMTFIVKFEKSGNRYLCDRTGAQTYIRFWAYIV